MATGFKDWTRAMVLLGDSDLGYIPVLLDDKGNLNIYLQGEIAPGEMHMIRVDDDGRIITKLRGRDGNYLVVDDLGYMTTVIKGQGTLGLQTVKVDDAGRLTAFMVDDLSVWDDLSIVGNAELAARMGSPVRFERSGQVFLLETFEDGIDKWDVVGAGDGAEGGLDPTTSRTGGYSARITGKSTTPWYTYLRYRQAALPVGKVGFSFAFSCGTVIDRVVARVIYYTPTYDLRAQWQWTYATGKVEVYDRATGWKDMGTVKYAGVGKNIFNQVKIVGDLDAQMHMRLKVNAELFDTSEWQLHKVEDTYYPGVELNIFVYSRDEENDVIYVDDVVLTYAET